MAKQSGKNSKSKSGWKAAPQSARTVGLSSIMDDLHQFSYPPELRIGRPRGASVSRPPVSAPAKKTPKPSEPVQQETPLSALAEVATCLWYIKTKHFKREWQNEDTADDDPRTRRTLGRLNKGADALKKCGLEVADPTGKRYPTGGEAMMRPLDFVPTQGLTYEKVTEAVMPLVYWHGRLIQRAEVFVAVPPAAEVKQDVSITLEGNKADTGGVAGGQSAEGKGSPTGDGPRTASIEQPVSNTECPMEGDPDAPSKEPPMATRTCESTQQKTDLATNATNDTASAGAGEQA